MKTEKVSMNELLPRIEITRYYDSEKVGAVKTRQRTTKSYEAGIYLCDGGDIYINGKIYSLKKHDIRFNKPGDSVYSIPHFKCMTVIFDFGEKDIYYSNQVLDGIPSFFRGNSKIADIFERILNSDRSCDEVSKTYANSMVLRLVTELYRLNNPEKTYSDTVNACILYMNQNFSSKISLENLGDATGYSPLHLSRLFLTEIGKTPHEFLTELRLEHAKQKLSESNITVNELAIQCGFLSESHFKTLFKKMVGKTPGAYRKDMRMLI